MSQHRSLKSLSGQRGQRRTVLKRSERLKILKKMGKWKEGELPYGLPKLRTGRTSL